MPFRDSKLTQLLMDSIGGTSLTVMFACVSPSSAHVAETLRTLNYATSAKNIKNKPVVLLDPQQTMVDELRREIQALRAENRALREALLSEPSSLRSSASGAQALGLSQPAFRDPSPAGRQSPAAEVLAARPSPARREAQSVAPKPRAIAQPVRARPPARRARLKSPRPPQVSSGLGAGWGVREAGAPAALARAPSPFLPY